MTTETWSPNFKKNTQSYLIDRAFLKTITKKLENDDNFDIASVLTLTEKEEHCPMMTLPENEWMPVIEKLSDIEILILIKFFTLAEQQFSGWRGNENSPVIYLSKAFRRRGGTLEKELLHWIKTNSDNKFLPYGPL